MKLYLTLILLIFSISLSAQKYTLNGYVSDIETGEKLVSATIVVDNKNAVLTNEYGYYSITINSSNSVNISANLLGYSSVNKEVTLKDNLTINFELKSTAKIDSVIVRGQIPISQTTEIGALTIPVSQLKLLPAIGAELDILKSFQLKPGVQAGTEGKSDIFVRGGSPDENLILLDDVPLYSINHLGGFISVFNTDAISSVKMYKGGFPARYSSRLSSVIDVRMKDGDTKNYHGLFSIGLLNTKIMYEGPIIKDKASFIISARVLPINIITKPFTFLVNEGQMIGYNFHDINAKLNYKVNEKNQLFLSLYNGDDDFSFDLSKLYSGDQSIHYDQKWGNNLAAFRWNHIFTPKLFMNTTLSYTRFRNLNKLTSKNDEDTSSFYYDFSTGIKDVSIKSTVDYNLSRSYKIKFGLNSIVHKFNPGITYYNSTTTDTVISYTSKASDEFYGFENIFFIENNFAIGNFLKANIGANFSDYYMHDTNYISLQPRIILNLIINKNLSIKGGYSEMEQCVHLLTNNSIGVTPDVWVPSDSDIKPSYSKQYSLGIFKHFEEKSIDFSIVSYYKTSTNLISYKEGGIFYGNAENWKNKIETGGNGLSYGIEVLLQKQQGKTTGWISYTYAKSTRQFDNINQGEPYPFKYDRRHDFSIVVNQKINDKISLSADWVYGSGYPYTIPIATYNTIDDGSYHQLSSLGFSYDQEIFIYADRNSYRMNSYHRLDISANFSKQVKKGIRTWTVSVYNTYNRANPFFYYTKYGKNDGKIHLFQQSLFPIIPSVSYSLKFWEHFR